MASALLAAGLVRRTTTSSSSFPLYTVARCWARRSPAPPATAVLPPGGLAAHVSASSLITTRRCLASHSAAPSSEILEKENLLELIDEGVQSAADHVSKKPPSLHRFVKELQRIWHPDGPFKDFPFDVVSNNGPYSITIEREFDEEKIKAVVDIHYYGTEVPVPHGRWNSSFIHHELRWEPKVGRMVITVEKAEGSIIKFHCKFYHHEDDDGEFDKEMVVQKVTLLNCGDCDSEYVYKGSSFSAEHEYKLQEALRYYLEVRGVNEDLDYWTTLYDCAEQLEDNHVLWWQNLKAFIEK